MDSGIVSTYYSVDEAIENGAAPIPLSFDRMLDVQSVIDLTDHLLACEVLRMQLLESSPRVVKNTLSNLLIFLHRQHGIKEGH